MLNLALQLPNIPVPLLLAVLPALLAGIFGFILGELRARLDTRRSDKAILKVVLFNQLELWEAVRLAEPGILLVKAFRAVDKIIHRFGGQRGALEATFRATDVREQQKFLDATKLNVKEELIERYEQSVAELASVDPILTHRLTNKTDLGISNVASTMIDNLVRACDPLFLVSESNTQLIERMKNFYKEKGAEWKIQNLKRDIKRVAWRISFRTWLRILFLLGKERFWISKEVRVAGLQLIRIFVDHYSKRDNHRGTAQTDAQGVGADLPRAVQVQDSGRDAKTDDAGRRPADASLQR